MLKKSLGGPDYGWIHALTSTLQNVSIITLKQM